MCFYKYAQQQDTFLSPAQIHIKRVYAPMLDFEAK
jgi:hypothetical protein